MSFKFQICRKYHKQLKNGKVFTSKISKALCTDILYYFWLKYQKYFSVQQQVRIYISSIEMNFCS